MGGLVSCFHSLKSVERSDAGRYWCQVEDGGETETSQPVWLTVEGEEAEPRGRVDLEQVRSARDHTYAQGSSVESGRPHCLWDRIAPDSRPSPYVQDLPTGVWGFESQGDD